MVRLVLSAFAVFSLAGCFVESANDRMPVPSDAISGYEPIDESRCEKRFSRGCVVGHIPVIKLYVEGEEFHDADNLYHRFSELVKVRDEKGLPLTNADYTFSMGTEFDTRTFAKGFEVYLTGDDYKRELVGTSGEFVLDGLAPGTYEIRVQKPIKFTVTRQVVPSIDEVQEGEEDDTIPGDDVLEQAEEPVAPSEPALIEESKTYCATLYTDISVDVRRGEMSRLEFNDFELHITDRVCEKGANNSQVNL